MKKLLLSLLLCAASWAEPQPLVYHTLPDPSYRLVKLGVSVVIQDNHGFFVGYYRPLPPAATFVPMPKKGGNFYTPSSRSGDEGYSTSDYGYGNDYSNCSSSRDDCGYGSSSSSSSGSSYSDPGGSPLCSPDYGFGR